MKPADEVLSYYQSVYLGEPVNADDFPRLLARAREAVSAATFGRADRAPDCFQ